MTGEAPVGGAGDVQEPQRADGAQRQPPARRGDTCTAITLIGRQCASVCSNVSHPNQVGFPTLVRTLLFGVVGDKQDDQASAALER